MSSLYKFRSKPWKYKGPAGWYFVTLPKTVAVKIRKKYGVAEEGWGRLKVEAKIGKTTWPTAIWFDTKAGSYLLPLKSVVRKKENISADNAVSIQLKFDPRELGTAKKLLSYR